MKRNKHAISVLSGTFQWDIRVTSPLVPLAVLYEIETPSREKNVHCFFFIKSARESPSIKRMTLAVLSMTLQSRW